MRKIFKQKKGKKEVIQNSMNVVSSVRKGTEEEMGIQSNGDGYVVQVWDGQSRYENGRKKYIREEVDTKKAAEKREKEIMKAFEEMRQEIQNLKPQVPEVSKNEKLLSVAAGEWLEGKKDDIALSTWQRYKGILIKHLLPVFGTMTVNDITTDLIADYFSQEKAKKNVSGTSLRQHFVVIENILKAEGSATMYDMKRPKKNDTSINCITDPALLKAFVDSFSDSVLYLPVVVAAATGMRLSEIAALRWRDINLNNGKIRVTRGLHWDNDDVGERYWYEKELKTKNAKRTITVEANVIKILQAAKDKADGKASDFVCKDTRGKPIGKNLGKNFSDQAKRQGYDISFHSLRHSHASILIMIYKVPIKTVSRRLGHADITVTLSIYTEFINELDEQAAAAMDNIFAIDEVTVEEVTKSAVEETNLDGNDTDLTRI